MRDLVPSLRGGVVQVLLNLGRGGLESMAVGLAISLRERGVPSAIVALDAGGEHEEVLARADVPYEILGGRRWARPEQHLRLRTTLNSLAPEAVHTHHFSPLAHSAVAVLLSRTKRLVHTEHSFQYLESRRDYRLALRALSQMCDGFVVVGNAMEQYYRDVVRVPGNRLMCIQNGVPIPATTLTRAERGRARAAAGLPDGFLVGTAGRFFPEKDYATLLRATATARRQAPALHLVMIGDGPQRGSLESLAAQLGLGSAITFLGWRPDVRDLLPLLDVFALSSISEGLPLVVLEAMAAGVPAITTPVGDLPEVLGGGKVGRLFPVGDSSALAQHLVEMHGDPAALQALASGARQRCAQEYSQDEMVNRYMRLYGLARS